MNRLILTALLSAPLVAVHAAEAPTAAGGSRIDRQALVTRHNVTLERYDASNPFQVGNGEFAFAVDTTGLQTFSAALGTFSNWGWHTFPNPQGYREEETLSEIVGGGGHQARYAFNLSPAPGATPQQKSRAQGAFNWYRRAPHRLHMGRIGFELLKGDGTVAIPGDLQKIRQTLDLWTGTVRSAFELEGVPVEVTTCCHPRQDALAVQVRSKLTVGVPASDCGCPPQPDMPVPPELDYELWQGSAPQAPYTEKRVTKPKAYERPGWMRHLYYCDGMITNWTTHWNDGAAFATGLDRTGPVEIEGTGEYPSPHSTDSDTIFHARPAPFETRRRESDSGSCPASSYNFPRGPETTPAPAS